MYLSQFFDAFRFGVGEGFLFTQPSAFPRRLPQTRSDIDPGWPLHFTRGRLCLRRSPSTISSHRLISKQYSFTKRRPTVSLRFLSFQVKGHLSTTTPNGPYPSVDEHYVWNRNLKNQAWITSLIEPEPPRADPGE
jgi:hypothetical protein